MRSIVWVMLLLTSMFACAHEAEQKPPRSECIVGFRLDWSGVDANRGDVLESIRDSVFASIRESFLERRQPSIPLATVATPDVATPKFDHLYLLFYDNCKNRHELAQQVLNSWQGLNVPLPRFVPIDGVICPSPRTIARRGPHWSDIDLPPCDIASLYLPSKDLSGCTLSLYPVNKAGAVESVPFIRPKHVVKIESYDDPDVPELARWLVSLNSEGAEINHAYTTRNVGGEIAVHCDGIEVSRPVILTPIPGEEFVFYVSREKR